MAPVGHICIFAKPPVPGRVKTRLIEALGPQGAAELAEAALHDTADRVLGLGWARATLATTDPASPLLAPLRARGVLVWDQGGGDLGARVERVLARALTLGPWAMALGADSPALPPEVLALARDALGRADAVIGPAADGGFYLLGLTRCPPGLLADLPWSQPHTCAAVEARLGHMGMTTARVASSYDVDVPADLEVLRADLAAHPDRAPRTAAWFRRRCR